LTTARGSGTNGFVTQNLSLLRLSHTSNYARQKEQEQKEQQKSLLDRTISQDLLDHDRKRNIEISLLVLRDKLQEEGLDEEAIEERISDSRNDLLKKLENGKIVQVDKKGRLSEHDVHHLAEAKRLENERFKNAFKIRSDHVEGAAFDQDLQ
ncbi:RNA-splicing factor, partial [Nowakowskiella sp. JEL0078]